MRRKAPSSHCLSAKIDEKFDHVPLLSFETRKTLTFLLPPNNSSISTVVSLLGNLGNPWLPLSSCTSPSLHDSSLVRSSADGSTNRKKSWTAPFVFNLVMLSLALWHSFKTTKGATTNGKKVSIVQALLNDGIWYLSVATLVNLVSVILASRKFALFSHSHAR